MRNVRQVTPPDEGQSIAGRAVRGSLWAAAGAYSTFAINFVGIAVLARYVSPADFGRFSLALAYNEIRLAVGLFPFGQSVVQSPRLPAIADTALIMAVVLRGGLLLLSLPVGLVVSHFNGSTVGTLFIELAAIDVLDGVRGSMAAVLERDLRFRGISIATVVAAAAAGFISVGAATLGFGAHALLLREAVLVAMVLAVYIAMGRRWGLPAGRSFNRATAHHVWRFAKGLFWVRSLQQVLGRIDRVVLGNTLGIEPLGYFHQAKYLATLPQAAMAPANMQVAIATYSRVRDDRAQLGRAFDMVQYVVLRVVPLGGIALWVFPEEILLVMYGTRWLPAAPALRVLGIFAMLGPVLESYRSLSTAMQDWTPLRWSVIAHGVLLLAALLVLTPRHGMVGAAWATCLAPVAGLAVLGRAAVRHIGSLRHGSVGPVCMAVAVSLAGGWAAQRLLPGNGAALLLLKLAATSVIYGLVLLGIERRRLVDRASYLRRHASS
jgi:O-antigen/teichoic acid export membrane protein